MAPGSPATISGWASMDVAALDSWRCWVSIGFMRTTWPTGAPKEGESDVCGARKQSAGRNGVFSPPVGDPPRSPSGRQGAVRRGVWDWRARVAVMVDLHFSPRRKGCEFRPCFGPGSCRPLGHWQRLTVSGGAATRLPGKCRPSNCEIIHKVISGRNGKTTPFGSRSWFADSPPVHNPRHDWVSRPPATPPRHANLRKTAWFLPRIEMTQARGCDQSPFDRPCRCSSAMSRIARSPD